MTNTTTRDNSSRSTLDAETLEMLATSLRHVLTETSERATDRPLGDRLDELGWAEVVADDAPTALRTLFEIKGEVVSADDALGPALTAKLIELTGDEALAGTVVTAPSPLGATVEAGAVLHVDAVTTGPLGDRAVVAVGDRFGAVPTGGLAATPLGGVDEALGLRHVTGDADAGDVIWLDAAAGTALVAHARWLLACELVGIGRHVIAAAVDYTRERIQYGKPIGVFQALQHRLAGAHALVVGAGHLVIEAGVAGDEWPATVAKCMAGRAAEHACTQAQQCYGAIGFTWEHEFHHYLRRTYSLDALFGDWRSLEHEIGARVQAAGRVPRVGQL